MKKLQFLVLALLGMFAVVSCEPESIEGNVEGVFERIAFELQGEEPITAAPDEAVSYKFTISYSEGLASVVTSLDGEEIESSKKSYADAPTEVEYTFDYTVKANQFGETLDFVFTATAANGYTQSVDYPLWVIANAVEFTMNIPSDVPAQIYSDGKVEFAVEVECGNVLKSIEVFKNDVKFASKEDFTTEKKFSYPFSYTPAAEDCDKDVVFRFVATDVKGNTTEAQFTVRVVKADAVGKVLYHEIFNTTMTISGTDQLNTIEGGITGGRATEFIASNIARYATLYTVNEETNEKTPNPGAMEGCTVHDGNLEALTYSSDGTNVCLSKYATSTITAVEGAHLWYRKAKNGWFQVDGIKLHGVTSLKLTYTQFDGALVASYSLDGGTTWTEIIKTEATSELYEQKFTLPQSAETISLRFTEGGASVHTRADNIKLVELLQ